MKEIKKEEKEIDKENKNKDDLIAKKNEIGN